MSQQTPGGELSAETLRGRIDAFLASRGYRPEGGAAAAPAASAPVATAPAAPAPVAPVAAPSAAAAAPKSEAAPAPERQAPAEFVCEDDVRQAVKANKKIVLGDRTIVTPSARDLGEQHRIFSSEGRR
jgi:pyruvate/2-oxoglutarate dehydrogenase complex dihydrolipoamide acyltransferase (E2) component